jgi:hypothetical protein
MHLPDKKIASIVHFFLRWSQLNINNLRYRRAANTKKIAPFIFTFATLAGNEDKHRNQAGITKLRVPRFSTALSFAVPPWLPVGIACTSTLPISNPIAAASDRKGTSLVPPLMRTGLLALDPSTFIFGIAFTARCKAMLFYCTSPLCISRPSQSKCNERK